MSVLSDLIDSLRNTTRDVVDDPYLWDDEEWIEYLNDAQNEIARRAHCLSSSLTLTLLTGIYYYSYTPDLVNVEEKGIISTDGSIVNKSTEDILDVNRVGWRDETGLPDTFIVDSIGKRIRVTPTPTSDYAGDTITINVKKMPNLALSESNTIPEIHPKYYEDMKTWSLHRAYQKKDAETFDPDKAMNYFALFNSIYPPSTDRNIERIMQEQPSTLRIMPRR